MEDIAAQNELRAKLACFTGSVEFYAHWSGILVYTEGVKFLAEHARLFWFIDLIASLQRRALRDAALRDFQLWELRLSNGEAAAICLRDSEDEAFRQVLRTPDSALDYVRVYVEGGVLLLPSEH